MHEMPRDVIDCASTPEHEVSGLDMNAAATNANVPSARIADPLFAVVNSSNSRLPPIDREFASGLPANGGRARSTLTRKFFIS